MILSRALYFGRNAEAEGESLRIYRIRGLFGGGFNLVVWQIFNGSPSLNHVVLTSTYEMN